MKPAEFWALDPIEFWWLVDAHKPVQRYGSLTENEVAELYDDLKAWAAEEKAAG